MKALNCNFWIHSHGIAGLPDYGTNFEYFNSVISKFEHFRFILFKLSGDGKWFR